MMRGSRQTSLDTIERTGEESFPANPRSQKKMEIVLEWLSVTTSPRDRVFDVIASVCKAWRSDARVRDALCTFLKSVGFLGLDCDRRSLRVLRAVASLSRFCHVTGGYVQRQYAYHVLLHAAPPCGPVVADLFTSRAHFVPSIKSICERELGVTQWNAANVGPPGLMWEGCSTLQGLSRTRVRIHSTRETSVQSLVASLHPPCLPIAFRVCSKTLAPKFTVP